MLINRNLATSVAMLFVLACSSQSLIAGTFFWGDVSDAAGDVMFLDVEENNAYTTSLFSPEPGTGSPVAIGNSIRFNPQGFQAGASGGTTATTSTVEMLLMARPGKTVNNLFVRELGDYTLSGLTGGAASVEVAGTFSWTIQEVNSSAVTLPTQVTPLTVVGGTGPNGGMLSRPGDDGTALPWTGSALLDFDAYLSANSIPGSVTKVLVEFENNLEATADNVSNAFIKKKEIGGFAIAANVPEPSSLVLLASLLAGVVGCRRR